MFESLNIPHAMSKAEFKASEPQLRSQLIDTQFDLLESGDFPVIVLLSGMDVLGRSAAAKQLMSWMDPRHLESFAILRQASGGQDRPRMWKFWRGLPPNGKIGIFLSSWYEGPTSAYFLKRIKRAQFKDHIDEINRFERILTLDGALLLKFMFLRPKDDNNNMMEKLEKDRSIAWKISEEEIEIGRQFAKRYEYAREVGEELLTATSTAHAPWLPLVSSDRFYRDITIGRTIVDAIQTRLSSQTSPAMESNGRLTIQTEGPNILDTLDLGKTLERNDYRKQLKKQQRRLTRLTLGKRFEKRALVAVFEGNDAAGKGGSIRRVLEALDPRVSQVIPIAAPSDEEKAHAYLWRFWNHVPRKGHVTIFDRSWYGRVLVERVEQLCTEDEWMRAYEEIRLFESELTDYGVIVVKFWLAIDKQEQLRRFKEREEIGYKRYKITDEDWRNRGEWESYAQAVHEMVNRTGTSKAPWTLVEANDKLQARIKVLKTINNRLEEAL